MKVHFTKVGRDQMEWTAKLSTLSDASLIRSIRKQGALKSRDISIVWQAEDAEPATRAHICVGPAMRHVGTLTVEGGAKL